MSPLRPQPPAPWDEAQRQTLAWIDRFVADTRSALHVRRADAMLMIRPDKTLPLNESAVEILASLYDRARAPAAQVLHGLAGRLRVRPARLLDDTRVLVDALGAVLREDFSPRPGLRFETFDRARLRFPTLAEIALTYGCQNECSFCYASSPHREPERPPMSAADVRLVMDRIYRDAHVPSLSFTGGEATLRPDLPELIRYGAELGFRVNLISNGLRLSNHAYARTLVGAGLASAQLSLEAASPALHDEIVGLPGAHAQTVAAVRNLRALGIHVHTNTTLCTQNLAHAEDLIRFVARDLGLKTLSMNMVIRTGEALAHEDVGLTYTQVAARLPDLLAVAEAEAVRLVWYSPIPYCIFNPVLHGLGAKSCACVDGIVSVDPTGEVLPCSSFETGIGSLVRQPFHRLYASRKARYWRDKRFVPPVCEGCEHEDLCGGACPLYWDAAGSFGELPRPGSDDPALYERWVRARRASGAFGVVPPGVHEGGE